jgi:hypothetical protein
MRIRTIALASTALIVVAGACQDGIVTPPPEAVLSTTVSDGTTYQIIALGGLITGGHGHSRANAIQRLATGGVVVVGSAMGDGLDFGDHKAVAWDVAADGSVSGPARLGELPLPFGDTHPYQSARDVNAGGAVVGVALYREGDFVYPQHTVAFIYDGEMRVLPWLVGATYARYAWEINDDGMVVGWIRYVAERDEDGNVTAVATSGALWLPPYEAEPILLPPLEGYTAAHARTINNQGMIAGWSWTGADTVGVYWDVDAAGSVSGPYELAPGFRSTALNESGYVAGHLAMEAALWNPDSRSLIQLGSLKSDPFSQASGISASDDDGSFQVVGWSGRTLDGTDRSPTVWYAANGRVGGPVGLPVPGGYRGGRAADGADLGWIVGVGFQKQGSNYTEQALLWKPTTDEAGDGECQPHPRHADRCK